MKVVTAAAVHSLVLQLSVKFKKQLHEWRWAQGSVQYSRKGGKLTLCDNGQSDQDHGTTEFF